MKQEGDLRGVCEKCDAWANKTCDGCFVGFGSQDPDTNESMQQGEMWDERCSTLCRDEDIAVGRLVPLGLFTWTYVDKEKVDDERKAVEADKRGDS